MAPAYPEAIERARAAFVSRDAEAFAECFAEDSELRLPRNLLEGGGYAGRDGAKEAIADSFETWADIQIEVEGSREIDGQFLLTTRVTNVGKPGTPSVEYIGYHLVRLRGEEIVSWRPYASEQDALEAARRRPSD
jgi:ketosteroid isomerase-like protein